MGISNKTEQAELIAIRGKGEALLGRETAIKLGVLKIGGDISAMIEIKQTLQQKCPKVFEPSYRTHRPNLRPVVQPLKCIPFNLRKAVEWKITELMDMDMIEPVSGPTPWVNPEVIVPKANSEIRLCLYMRQANCAIVREHYPIPTADEILQGIYGSNIFSRI